jgi:hypothetical protein
MVARGLSNAEGREKAEAMRLGGLCLSDGLPHQFRQGNDVMHSAYAILKIPPKGYAQLPAGLLQADESITAAPAQLAPRTGADLPLLRPLPDVALREVVVCALRRHVESSGANPDRRCSSQPEALGAVQEVTNGLKHSKKRPRRGSAGRAGCNAQ